jgi:hypothetical protein
MKINDLPDKTCQQYGQCAYSQTLLMTRQRQLFTGTDYSYAHFDNIQHIESVRNKIYSALL